MKPAEILFEPKRRYALVMLLCFLYSGFSIMLFAYQSYSLIWRSEIAGFGPSGMFPRDGNRLLAADANRFLDDENRQPPSRDFSHVPRSPAAIMSSPESIIYLIGGIVALLAGLTIMGLVREKEIKSVKQQIAKNLLLPDEQAILGALHKAGGELTQSNLARETGLGKVQVHRAVKRLESRGIVEKHGYGLTNKILLKKEF